MALVAFTQEERIGLALSVAAHGALLAVLMLRPDSGPVVRPPERIEVTISDDVGLVSTSPEPFAPAAASVAPELGDPAPAEVLAEPEPERPPVPEPPTPAPPPPKATPAPRPAPRAAPSPTPAPAPRPAARPAARATPTPAPAPRPAARPAPARPAASTSAPAATQPARAGASRIGSDFLEGAVSADARGASSSPAAATIGPRVQAALSGAISRALKPHWSAPPGPEVEDIVTVLAWNLNRNGTLAGTPRVVRQTGVNDVNRAQAPRHAEQAIRAVQLAAPFNLPAEYYDGWRRVSEFRFDKRLSQ